MKKKLKKKSIITILLILALMIGVPTISYAAEGDVAINASNFPDENFRTAVEGFDVDDDGTLTLAELNDVTSINVKDEDISDLTGIEHFTNLKELNCEHIKLTKLDVSKNTKLEDLNCNRNQLESLDVTKNTKLKNLNCYGNKLTSLDLSKNIQLEVLDCDSNQLTSLDVSNNIKLKELFFDGNQLTSIDVSKNTQLEYLRCGDNKLTSLDLSQNTNLEGLECGQNQLRFLDVSKNTKLKYLACYDNQLTSLDLSKNTALEQLGHNPQFPNITGVAILEDGKYVLDLKATLPDIDIAMVEDVQVIDIDDEEKEYDSDYDSKTHRVRFDKDAGPSSQIMYLYNINVKNDAIDPEEGHMFIVFNWKAGYTLTFHSNGGSAVETQNIISGERATEPTPPKKEGHTFAGWFKDEALVEEFDMERPITENTTLYAKWQVNEKPPVEDDSGKEDPKDGAVNDDPVREVEDDSGKEDPKDGAVNDDPVREVEDSTKPVDNKLGEKTLPKTGTVPPTLFYGLGGLSIWMGMAMRRKKNSGK